MKKYLYLLLLASGSLFAQQLSFWDTYTQALRGDKIAQFQTGVIYERGIGVEVNQSHAAQWYLKSASQGYMDAQYNIGIMYIAGRGVEQNSTAGMMWLASAAKQGDKEAKSLLLEIIDGKHEKHEKPKDEKGKKPLLREMVSISPVRLKTIKPASICDHEGNCESVGAHVTITSKIKSGKYYKVSGTSGKTGWVPYTSEGWISEESVEPSPLAK